jgi:hypothetical protein
VLAAHTPGLAKGGCDLTGTVDSLTAAAREAIEEACPCEGFESHGEYTRCVKGVTEIRRGAGLLSRACANAFRRRAKRSTCSFETPRVACCEGRAGKAPACRIRSTEGCTSSVRIERTACGSASFCDETRCGPAPVCDPEVLYAAEGNRLRRFDLDSITSPPLVEDVLIERADLDPNGRDINGQICPLRDGTGRFIAGEDTDQPHPPPGWGVFAPDGTQVGKLTATYLTEGAEPFGCSFDADYRFLFTTEVGNQATGEPNGQLILWFPPFDRFPGPPGAYPATDEPSTNFCKIAVDIGTAGSVAVDTLGRVYVASARGEGILRFSPPFPTGPDAAGGCGALDPLGSPLATTVQREVFATLTTASGIARAPSGNWFFGSVLTGTIGEYDSAGNPVRPILEPAPGQPTLPLATGHPQGLAVDCRGDLYYADLSLTVSGGGIGPGPNGTVRRIGFDVCGAPAAPAIVRDGLAFPDGLGILRGDLEAAALRR